VTASFIDPGKGLPPNVGASVKVMVLPATERLGSGEREDIVRELSRATERRSVIGSYSITPSGDTDVPRYDVSRIVGGKLITPTSAPPLRERSP